MVAQLSRWSPILWVCSGLVGLVYASLYGVEAVIGTYPAARSFLGPLMNIGAFTALLGLYPVVVDRNPWVARGGGMAAVFAIVGSVVALGEAAGIVSTDAGWFVASQLLFIVVGMTVAFLAYAFAGLRSTNSSRAMGLLLLIPALIMGLNLGIVVTGYASPSGRLLVSGLWAMSYLALGIQLTREDGSRNSSKEAPGTATP